MFVVLNCSCGVRLEFRADEREKIEQVKAEHRAKGHKVQESGGVRRDSSIIVANRELEYRNGYWLERY
ncbi:MAG TPA: hypothetical protein VGL27_09650 [Negativicutes bacterium]|jgi:hypothetical protein